MTYNPSLSTLGRRNLSYGDGSDGFVSVSGSTITGGKFYQGFVNRSGTLTGNSGCAFYCLGTFSVGGTWNQNGGNAAGSVAGTASLGGPCPNPGASSAGITTAATAQTGQVGVGLSGDGGGGGLSGGTTQADGSHSQLFTRCSTALAGNALSGPLQALFGTVATNGRGSGDGTNAGGGAGSGGKTIYVACHELNGIAGVVVQSVGGTGGNGAAGTAGGGGAGGGGGSLMIYDLATGASLAPTLTHGTGGSGQGGAGTGGGGTNGTSLTVTNT